VRKALILIIDNYDSFTYNLVQAIGPQNPPHEIKVVLNDQVTVPDIRKWNPSHIIVSPGPCTPKEAGISIEVIQRFAGKMPILGVCLGHQCIAQAFGATVTRAEWIMHGKTSPIHHAGTGLYAGMPNPFTAARYHSLVVDLSTLPQGFEVTAWTDQHELMGIRHHTWKLDGVQFHPESFLTPHGLKLLENFLQAG
jgi:anthranilate synthase/aminodeoxychorismate synthase-like glutamine amidotransferase